jgi:hypothetical protein
MAGPKLTIKDGHEATPSETIVKAGNQPVVVIDGLGRSIAIRKPRPLDNLDFAKAAGSDKINLVYLAEVSHLKFVREIDGDPVSTPQNELQLRGLYQRLGDEGNEAVQKAVAEHFYQVAASEDDLKNS